MLITKIDVAFVLDVFYYKFGGKAGRKEAGPTRS